MIKNCYFKFLLIVPLLLLSSCSEIADNIHQNNVQDNYVSPYMGKWMGTYSSNEVSGTLILNVSKSGSVEVTRIADGNEEVYYTSLQEPGGNLNAAPSPKGFTLYGSLHNKSGTWKLQYWSGNWSVTKQ